MLTGLSDHNINAHVGVSMWAEIKEN